MTQPGLINPLDNPNLISRRGFLGIFAATGTVALVGCGSPEEGRTPGNPNAGANTIDQVNDMVEGLPQSYEGPDPGGHARRFNEVMGDLDAHPGLSDAIRDALNTDNPDLKPSIPLPVAASYSFFGSRALMLSVVPTPSEVDGTERTLVIGGAKASRDPRLGGAKYYYTGEKFPQPLNPGFLLAAYPEYEIHVELVAASSADEFARRQSPGVQGGLDLTINTAAAINAAMQR